MPTETADEVKDEIYKELQLKLEQRQNAEKVRITSYPDFEKENLLQQTNSEVEKLQQLKNKQQLLLITSQNSIRKYYFTR